MLLPGPGPDVDGNSIEWEDGDVGSVDTVDGTEDSNEDEDDDDEVDDDGAGEIDSRCFRLVEEDERCRFNDMVLNEEVVILFSALR